MPVIDGVEANNTIREYEVEAGLPSAYIVAMKVNIMKEDRKIQGSWTQCLSPKAFYPATA
ncbi:MAG: hypothetical protein P8I92_02180 [Schleiferiaceae bacterium]|nr:hypothetical protein [Schleiferiaceae bacterium]